MTLETDYLIIGAGASGMAFADTLLKESDATMIIVDKHAKPGGHWNDAYPFVTLHQPSAFYGVNSLELSKGRIDQRGWNKGLNELATGAEIKAYYEEVMRNHLLPSGRVQYFPLCEYKGDYKFTHLLSGENFKVKVHRKLVDATYLNTEVPSTHTPNFEIEPGVQFIPLNDLPKIQKPPAGFVIVGGGKTGIDACLWLLENRVNPNNITWIISRDGWLIDRRNSQPTEEFFEDTMGAQAAQLEACAKATSIDNLFERLEDEGVLMRFDKRVKPAMFHGATVSKEELKQLQRIKNVIRLGRVQRLEKDKIVFKDDFIPTSPNHVHVDCSATPIRADIEMIPVFNGDLITPQTVRSYQPVFSAAFIAFIEANYEDENEKNKLCSVVPLPNHDTDWLRMQLSLMVNVATWGKYKNIGEWLIQHRLDGFTKLARGASKEDLPKQAILKKLRQNIVPAMMNLHQFIKELDAPKQTTPELGQLQVRKNIHFIDRIAEIPKESLEIEDGEILVKIEKFAFSANNITYAVTGDRIGYWQFFPANDDKTNEWGVIPVWGFAKVVESNVEGIPLGDRLFGYFPPASHLKMAPNGVTDKRFFDGAEHRSKLPRGYNIYRRVAAEPGYNQKMDQERALLFPLFLTSFCIWDSLQDSGWYQAEQILVLSASSKTSIGLGYALQADTTAPHVIGVTSAHNLETVKKLNLYDECISYKDLQNIKSDTPTVIIDMSGNSTVLATLHELLGDQMIKTINVGITHWTDARPKPGIIAERSEFFFAPGHIQKRMKEWGPGGFDQRSGAFMMVSTMKTKEWLTFKKLKGLEELSEVLPDVCKGTVSPDVGLIVEMD